jgi:hypothetical protein
MNELDIKCGTLVMFTDGTSARHGRFLAKKVEDRKYVRIYVPEGFLHGYYNRQSCDDVCIAPAIIRVFYEHN